MREILERRFDVVAHEVLRCHRRISSVNHAHMLLLKFDIGIWVQCIVFWIMMWRGLFFLWTNNLCAQENSEIVWEHSARLQFDLMLPFATVSSILIKILWYFFHHLLSYKPYATPFSALTGNYVVWKLIKIQKHIHELIY